MKTYCMFICLIISSTSFALTKQCENRLAQLGPNWTYSTVEVPLDYQDPMNLERLEIYFYYKKDQIRFQDKTPILFINGGPTISSGAGSTLFDNVKELRDANIILMDQRGTGCSGSFPDYNISQDIKIYKNFASTSIVRDAEKIRESFYPGKKWKVYGQSFGGLVGFRYIEMFPESLHSVHIHGFGFTKKEENLLDIREKRLNEVGQELLGYNNKAVSDQSVGELLDYLYQDPQTSPAHHFFSEICFDTKGAKLGAVCGKEVLSGLFLMVGFKNQWPLMHKKLSDLVNLMKQSRLSELEKYYRNFTNTFILRFNERNQAYALNTITYLELIPGKFFYSGCDKTPENLIISECRFEENYLIRLPETLELTPNPVNLEKVRNNIKNHDFKLYYYSGMKDTFLPYQLHAHTAKILDIEDRLTVFSDSGHEGFYSEPLVLSNLLKE